MTKDTEVVILTETGITKNEKIWTCNDELEVAKENKA